MLIHIHKDVVNICENAQLNLENYMESLKYISNLYLFINKIKLVVPTMEMDFLPSFKGEYTSQKLNISTTEKESTLKVFNICSQSFLEDGILEKLNKVLTPLCESIEQKDTKTFTFIMN